MLNYNKLKKLALKFQNTDINGFNLAKQLNIETKTESELLRELGGEYSLLNGNPALILSANKFVICYNPQTAYIDYYISHECSHYILKHNEDNRNNEDEANLLTCLILAPPEKLVQQGLYTVGGIIGHYNIPIDKAKQYIDILFEKDKEYIKAFSDYLKSTKKDKIPDKKYFIFFSLATVLISTVFIFLYLSMYRNTDMHMINPEAFSQNGTLSNKIIAETSIRIETTTESNTESVIAEPSAQSDMKVKVTKSGKKYHLPDCHYVAYKNNTIELEIGEALKMGYVPCSVCRPE